MLRKAKIIAAALLFSACLLHAETRSAPSKTGLSNNWWKEAVFYQLYVRAFKDFDGDGIGDIRGVISKLDYLRELGIGGIWLLPVNKSADHDHGYAVTDYFELEEDYGTLNDFKLLLAEAHKRNIGVIIDLVVNHSARKHPFFQEAENDPASKYRQYYVWSDEPRDDWTHNGKNPWKKTNTGYYFTTFTGNVADWNYTNPAVRDYMHKILDYWLSLGVDGFRFDAVQHLVENRTARQKHQPETHDVLRGIRKVLDRYPGSFAVGEVADAKHVFDYLGNGVDELHSTFTFGLNYRIMKGVRTGQLAEIRDFLDERLLPGMKDKAGSRPSLFLANHDPFAGSRVMTQCNGDTNKAKLAAACLLTLPGIPFVYYGEEIGMENSEKKYRQDGHALRSAMQWDTSKHGGFSTADTIFRAASDKYDTCNVQQQGADPGSVLFHYKNLIRTRNRHRALKYGGYENIETNNDEKYLAFLRMVKDEVILVVMNFKGFPQTIQVDLESSKTRLGEYAKAVHLLRPGAPEIDIGNWRTITVKAAPREAMALRLENGSGVSVSRTGLAQ